MLTAGRYTAWFRTPIGEGAGIVELRPDGELSGRDDSFAYTGSWESSEERFKASLAVKRAVAGPPGVFGLDEIDIAVSGVSRGEASISCTGFAKQSPGLKLEITLIRAGN